MQRFLQLVSQSFLMLSRTGNYFQMASFYWLLNKNIARQVARGMLHCAMAKKCVAALRQLLGKVEPDSTSCNASCNKMLRDFMIARHVTPCNFACNLCRNKIARQVATQVA